MQNRIYNTKAIVETAIMSALLVMFMVMGEYIPFVSAVGIFFLPIPITLIYIRYNYKYSLAATLIGFIMGIFLITLISSAVVTISSGLVGFTLGYCIKNKVKYSKTILFVGIAFLISTIIQFQIYALFTNEGGIVSSIDKMVVVLKQYVNESKLQYARSGMDKATIDKLTSSFDVVNKENILKSIAAGFIVISLIFSYLNYNITRSILKKIKIEMDEPIAISKIYFNNLFSAFLIIFLCIGILLKNKNIVIGDYISSTSLILFQYIFVIQGISVVTYYLKNKFKLKNSGITVIIVITVMSPLYLLYLYGGIGDMILDFRKIDTSRHRRNLEE